MLSDRSAGLLGPYRERWLRRHLAECDACRHEEEVLARVLMLLDRVPPLAPPPGLWYGVEAKIRAEARARAAAPRIRWKPVGAAAAAGTVVLLAAASYLLPEPEPAVTFTRLPPDSLAYIETHALNARSGPLADHVGLISFATVAGRQRAVGASGW
ncbi:MAG: hypothetical protein GX774_08075 [Armatimonadetes bacterium]|nr:hypothetical protein [Armatimonadota bacterium]